MAKKANGFLFSNCEKLQLERFWFDNVITQNRRVPEQVRAAVFNELTDSQKRPILLNLWAETNLEPATLVEENMALNPYQELMDDTPFLLVALKSFCVHLGMSSSHDETCSFTDDQLNDKMRVLRESLQDLRQYIRFNLSTAKSPVTALKNDIASFLTAFGGIKLTKNQGRKQVNKNRAIHNTFCISVTDKYAQQVLQVVTPRQRPSHSDDDTDEEEDE